MAVKFTFNITERPTELGGGWRLRLYENGVEVGGGIFEAVWEMGSDVDVAYLEALQEAAVWCAGNDSRGDHFQSLPSNVFTAIAR